MKANSMVLKLVGLAFVATVSAGAFIACSSDNNAAPTVVDGGDDGSSSSGSSSGGSSSGASSSSSSSSGGSSSSGSSSGDSGPACTSDAGAAHCNSCATVGNDTYNTCSAFGCAGPYDNAAHGVPSTLPTL